MCIYWMCGARITSAILISPEAGDGGDWSDVGGTINRRTPNWIWGSAEKAIQNCISLQNMNIN